jgi:hypothetical protein
VFATADEDFLKVIALVMYIYILFASPASAKLGPHTLDLIRTDDVKINREECQKVEDQLGQIFYVNVDSFQTVGHAVNPEYVRMVKDLNIGGVLPKFGLNTDLTMVRKATAALQNIYCAPDSYVLLFQNFFSNRNQLSGQSIIFWLVEIKSCHLKFAHYRKNLGTVFSNYWRLGFP